MNSIYYRPNENQSLAINYAKAIGIIMVVIGHYHGSPFDFYRPYVFHMPLFFFIGGLLFNPINSPKKFYIGIIQKYILYALVTYIVIGLIAVFFRDHYGANIAGNPFKGSILSDVTSNYKSNFDQNTYFMVLWFIVCYAVMTSFWFPILKIIKDIRYISVALIALVPIFAYLGMDHFSTKFQETRNINYNYLSQFFTASTFFLLGITLKQRLWSFLNVYGFIVAFLIIYITQKTGISGSAAMAWSKYPNNFYESFIRISCGIYSVFYISKLLSSDKKYSFLEKVGTESKAIMSYHIIWFLLIDFVMQMLGYYNVNKSSPLEHYYTPYAFPLYILIPVVAPVLLSITQKKTLARFFRKR